MDYVSAIVPPLVMAVGFTVVIRAIIRSQGGAQKAKEDAYVDAVAAETAAGPRNAAE